jgi:hypothetical protein
MSKKSFELRCCARRNPSTLGQAERSVIWSRLKPRPEPSPKPSPNHVRTMSQTRPFRFLSSPGSVRSACSWRRAPSASCAAGAIQFPKSPRARANTCLRAPTEIGTKPGGLNTSAARISDFKSQNSWKQIGTGAIYFRHISATMRHNSAEGSSDVVGTGANYFREWGGIFCLT